MSGGRNRHLPTHCPLGFVSQRSLQGPPLLDPLLIASQATGVWVGSFLLFWSCFPSIPRTKVSFSHSCRPLHLLGREKSKSPKSIKFGEFAEALSALGPDFKSLRPWDKRSLEEIKLSFFIDNIIEHVENSKESTNKLSELVSEFSKVSGCQTKTSCISLCQHQAT